MTQTNALNLGNIVFAGADIPNIFEYNIPVTTGLVAEFLMAHGRPPGRNYANGKTSSIVGAPVVGANYTTVNYQNYIDTGVPDTKEITVVSVFSGTSGSPVVANNPLGAGGGFGVYFTAGGVNAYASRTDGGSSVIHPNPTAMHLFNAVAGDAQHTVLTDVTIGYSRENSTIVGSRVAKSGSNLLIGYHDNNKLADTKIGLMLIYDRVLPQNELDLVNAWVRQYMEAQGVAV